MKLRRRIGSAFLALVMVLSLIPTVAVSALAATAEGDNSLVTLEYENDGVANNFHVNVSVYTDQAETPIDSFTVDDARMADNDMKITVKDSTTYEIDHVDFDGVSVGTSEWITPDLRSYSFTCSFIAGSSETLNVSVYLRSVQEKPAVEGDVYDDWTLDVSLRAYDAQLLKMLYLADKSVSPATEIKSIKYNFYHGVNDAVVDENSINREEDYWDCLYLDNFHGWIVPNNVKNLEITYKDNANANEQTVTIPAGDLRFVRTEIGGQPAYEIEANDQSTHIVYFYNETDGHAGNNYFPYAIRFVTSGQALGDQMPTDPTYQDSSYKFVNWEQNDWDGNGMPFLSTTIINDDVTVFARKISSSEGGTEIHISNEDNLLFDRVAELANEKYDDINISAADIDEDNIEIVVVDANGNETAKDKSEDGWMPAHSDWYRVFSTQGLDHIDFSQIEEIEVYFGIDDTEYMVTIPVGEYPGDLSVRMTNRENVVDLLVNGSEVQQRPQDPDPGTPDQVTITYHGNGGIFTNKDGQTFDTLTETGTYGSQLTLYNTTYYFQQEGYTNLGWSTTENGSVNFQGAAEVTLDDETFSGLSETKHIDLYAVWAKDAPTFDELNNLGLKVTIDCVSNVGHGDGQVSLIESTPQNPTCVIKDEGNNTYTISIDDPDDYIAQYNKMGQAEGYTHTYFGFQDNVKAFKVYWDGTQWVVDQDKVTILAKCMPEAPTDDQLKTLLDDAVKVQCVEESTHNCTFDVKDGYTVSGPTADGNGSWTYTVTVTADPYVADFNGKGKGEHWLVDSNAKTKDIVLTWNAADQTWAKPDQVVFDVTCKPTAPTTEDLNTLFPNGVQVDCLTQGAHDNKDYDLEDNTYTTTVEQKDGKWTCKVIVTGETYVEKYEGAIGWPHTANNATRSVTLVWENGKWAKQDNNNVMVVFDVKCQAPGAPTYGQLKDLFKVQIDCITSDKWGDQYEHKNKDYAPIEGSYTLGNVTANANGTWDLVVTVKADKYVEQYSVDRNETHTLADAYSSKTVTLVYQNGAWTKPGDDIAFTFDVNCNPKYDLVYHGCGGTTENDKETVSSTFPYFGEAIIKNNPFLRDGYVFEGWALEDGGDVVYTGGEDVTFNDTTFPGLSTAKKAELYAVWALAAPDADDIANLDIKVVIDCIDNVGHEDGTYDLLDSRLADPTYVYTLGVVNQKDETCKLTIFAAEYVKAYGEEENIQARHKLADENVWYQTIELKWVDGKWTADTTKVTFNVTGDKEYDPNEPAVVNYTVNYFYDGEQNKDASYTGWGRAGDVVNRYIDKSSDGYTLDKVTGVPLTLAVDGENIINVYYATDKWNAETDDPTTGDSIPDYKQVLIAYTTDGSGTVSPTTQVETLEDNADGKYVGTVNVGSTATANEGYAFAFWMGPNDSTFWSKVLNTTLTVEGGKTYTYTATFGTDLIGPEDPTGEDPDKPGDGIPDKYQVVVKYVADKGGKITGKQVEVLTIYDADGHYSIVGDVTATGSQAAAFHNWDFSRWVAPNGGVASWHPTLDQQTIENAEGGNTYVFTAHFRYDPYIPPVVDPDPDDPTPPPVDPDDKPELNTEDHYAYIVGYPDGTVRPEGDITRAEVATIFFRLLTDESRDEFWSQTNDYTDVDADAWYNNAVSTLSNAGILNGYEDGTFQPDGNITRAEFATITARFFEATYEGEDLFSDIAGHWAADYINQAANAGIVDGYPDGTFRPQQNITRAEAMTMVNRTIDRHPDAEHFLDGMITWSDNHEDAWYYEQVQEATNSHEYTMNTDDEQNPYEIWTELLPVRDWAQLEKEWSDAHSGQSGGDVV